MTMRATLASMNPLALMEATAAVRSGVLGAMATDPVVLRALPIKSSANSGRRSQEAKPAGALPGVPAPGSRIYGKR
jgi:hypothetical protein